MTPLLSLLSPNRREVAAAAPDPAAEAAEALALVVATVSGDVADAVATLLVCAAQGHATRVMAAALDVQAKLDIAIGGLRPHSVAGHTYDPETAATALRSRLDTAAYTLALDLGGQQ